jgi:glucose uptake protein
MPTSILALLFISLLCLGSWITTFKLAGKRWRFEFFSLDFALGAVLLSLIAALTVGNTAADLPFSDRVLLSSKTAQALVFSAGFIFGLANLLLLGAVSLLGIAGAFPISIGLGVIVYALLNFRSYHSFAAATGLALLGVGVFLDARACRLQDLAMPPAKKAVTQAAGAKGARSLKGLIVALIGGVLFGVFYSLAEGGLYGDLGLGPYAGLLYFCLGILVSTLVFSVVFFNIALEGGSLTLRSYLAGQLRQHLLGIVGGAIWAAGALTAFLAKIRVPEAGRLQAFVGALPLASALLAALWGILIWREFASAPKRARGSVMGTAALLAVSLLLITWASAH